MFDLFRKSNQTPIPEKIIKIERKMKDWAVVVVACSATESTNGFSVVRNGLIALRYLKEGSSMNTEFALTMITVMPEIIVAPKKYNPWRNHTLHPLLDYSSR